MSVTTERTTASTTSAATGTADTVTVVRRRLPWTVVVVTCAALATCAAVGTWAWVATRPAPTVAAQALGTSWAASYGPGSSVYDEQVPSDPTAWTRPYGPGSAVYAGQVPADPTTWTALYGPGSAVYAEQVPSAAGEQTALSPDELMGLRWTEGPTAALLAHYSTVPTTR